MCVAQGRSIEIYGNVPERSANSINRDWVGKRKLFFHSWWQRGKPILPYGKASSMQKRRMKTIHMIHVCRASVSDASRMSTPPREIVMMICDMKILAAFVFSGFAAVAFAEDSGQTVFVNGNIYTMNERQPHAEALAVKGDRIVFVGSNADVKKYQTAGAKTVDLGGKTVVPGLTDAHCHIFGIGNAS